MRRVEADSTTLLRQAPMTAGEYMDKAIENYAKAHPELIAAFMQAAAIDMGTALIAGPIEDLSVSDYESERLYQVRTTRLMRS